MSATLVSSNTTTKVNRAIFGATTVNSNSYAVVDYICTANTSVTNNNSINGFIQRYFGPGQSVPSSFTAAIQAVSGSTTPTTGTYTLQSGVEFINTP